MNIDDAPDRETLAMDLYSVYCQAVGNKAYDGKPLPDADVFFSDPAKTLQANAWKKVAGAALDTLCE